MFINAPSTENDETIGNVENLLTEQSGKIEL